MSYLTFYVNMYHKSIKYLINYWFFFFIMFIIKKHNIVQSAFKGISIYKMGHLKQKTEYLRN